MQLPTQLELTVQLLLVFEEVVAVFAVRVFHHQAMYVFVLLQGN
jgi:hypothetical protein